MLLFGTILVLEKSFSKASAILCTAANWASISVRWEENQAVEGLDEARGCATIWLFIALQSSDFTSSAATFSASPLVSMWLSDGDSSATTSVWWTRKWSNFRTALFVHIWQTVVDLRTNTRVSGALLEISYNWNVGLWLRGGSRTPNNRCCEQMKLSWCRRGCVDGSELWSTWAEVERQILV